MQSVYEDLIPRPSQMATDGEDDSDSDEERRERLLSLRSYKLLNAPSGPKIPSVERLNNSPCHSNNCYVVLCS